MPNGNAFNLPETVEGWQKAAVCDTKPPQISNGHMYLLNGTITVGPGINLTHLSLRQYVLDIAYPDGASSSATLTIKSMSPSVERQGERDLDEIVRGYVVNKPAPKGLVGVYRIQNRTISIGYLLIPHVVEAVINHFNVRQLTDLRIK